MSFLGEVFEEALRVLSDFGPELRQVLWLTLLVSGAATLIGVVVGVPAGVWLGLDRFRGRGLLLTLVTGYVKVAKNVVVGLDLSHTVLWTVTTLHNRGWVFYTFIGSGHCRFMCSWATTDEDIHALTNDIREVMKAPE